MDLATQKSAYRKDDRTRSELETHRGDDAGNAAVFDPEVGDFGLEQRQVRLVLDDQADRFLIESAVGLRSRRTNGRALAGIERAELDAGTVDRARHRTAQRIDFTDEVPLADTADRRVAAHLSQGLDALRDEQSACTASCRGERGLGAGMAATHHDHVEIFGEMTHRRTLSGHCRARHRHPQRGEPQFHETPGLPLVAVLPVTVPMPFEQVVDDVHAPAVPLSQHVKILVQQQFGIGEEVIDRTPQVDRVVARRGRGVPVQPREPGMLTQHDVVDRVAEDVCECPP